MSLEESIYQKSAGVLAFVGDSVFSTEVRSRLALKYDYNAGELNIKANAVVCATSQAKLLVKVSSILSEREHDIAIRARNISPKNVAKNSTLANYSMATSLEAVIGYLSLSQQTERLGVIMDTVLGEIL